MNNKKIIFGILLFCAISFVAYTFANPLENKDEEGKLMPGNSTQVNSPNNNQPGEDDENDNLPVEEEPTEDENNEPVAEIPQPTTPTTPNRPTNPTNPSRPTTPPVDNTVAVSGVTLTTTMPVLSVGKTTNLGVAVSPSNATNKNVTYNSSNPSVATVDANGTVTGVGAGTTVITVTSNNGKTSSVTITIVENMSSKVTVLSANNNTTITNSTQAGNAIYINGSVHPNGSDFKVRVRVSVPTTYTRDVLLGVKYYIGTNGYGIPQSISSGIDKIKNISDLKNGGAYIEIDVPFGEAIITDSGKLNVIVNWLGNNNPITYSLDFSGVTTIY